MRKFLIIFAALFSISSFAADIDFAGRVRTIGEGLVVKNHANIPYQYGISVGTVPKNQTGSGGIGTIKFFSDDAPIYPAPEAYLQGTIGLVTDPDPLMRRLKAECIEQGTRYCSLTLNEQGGNVGVGTNNPLAQFQITTPSNPSGYTEALRIEGGNLASGWERGISFTGNGGSFHVGTLAAYLYGLDREVRIYVAGYLMFRIHQDGAVMIGNPSGGFMGPGTLNVEGQIYRNGTPVP